MSYAYESNQQQQQAAGNCIVIKGYVVRLE